MLLTKTVKVKVRKDTCEHFNNKGYKCKPKDIIEINTMDLPPHSSIKIRYRCDNPDCLSEHELRFEDYLKKRKRIYSDSGDFCEKCSKWARMNWYKQNRPDEWKTKYEKAHQKTEKTLMKKYGVDNVMKIPEIVDKLKESIMEKYGVDNVMKVEEIKQRLNASLLKNSEYIEEVQSKNGLVYYRSHGVFCSQNQHTIWELYGGELNKFIDNLYPVDILLEDNIYFEYDGTGHELSIKMGHETEEEFKLREIKRYYTLKQKGYKQFRFISLTKSGLPSPETLLRIKDVALQYLKESENNHWIEFNYDNNTIRTKQYCEYFDYK